MNNNLFSKIVEGLLLDPFFSDYKYRKKGCRLIKTNSDGFDAIVLHNWDGYDLKRDCRALVIEPIYLKRFDILHKWFEKHSFKSLTDQRDSYSIGFDGKMLNDFSEFYFKLEGIDFEQDFALMKSKIINYSHQVFNNYNSLSKLYDKEIVPILENDRALPNVGADWVFEYLKLVRIVSPENYEKVKTIILKQVELLNSKGEPNIIEYYPKLSNILFTLEEI